MNGAHEFVEVDWCGEDELRGGMCAVVTEGEVFPVEADEENRQDENHDQGDAGEDDDEEKVGLVGWELLDFHKELDAWGGRVGAFFDFELGCGRNLTDDGRM